MVKRSHFILLGAILLLFLFTFPGEVLSFRHLDNDQGHDFIIIGLGVFRQNFTQVEGSRFTFEDSDDGFPEEYSNTSRLSLFGEGKVYEHYTFELDAQYHQEDRSRAQDFTAYLKVNRDQDYLILGDHKESTFEETIFTALDHKLRGATVHGELAQTAGTVMFGALRGERAVELIPADGTSGPYRLENLPLVQASEVVEIQVRDRNQAERILRTERQLRGVHYTIDYEAGKIVFRNPVDTADFRGNPIFIMVTYQYESFDGMFNRSVWGARAAVAPHETMKFGVTYLADGPWDNNVSQSWDERRQIMGADLTLNLSERYKIGAEFAQSNTPGLDDTASADAVRINIDTNPVDSLSVYGRYWRVERPFLTFGSSQLASDSVYDQLDQEIAFIFKTTDITFDLDPNINANLGTDEESLGLSTAYQATENGKISAGIRHTRDNIPNEELRPVTTDRNMFASYKYTPAQRTNLLLGAEQIRQFDDSAPRTFDNNANRLLAGLKQPLGKIRYLNEMNLLAAYQYEDYDDYRDESQSEIVHDLIGRFECYPGSQLMVYAEQAEQWIYQKQLSKMTYRSDISAAGFSGWLHPNLNLDAGAKYRQRIDLIADRQDLTEQIYALDLTLKPAKSFRSQFKIEYRHFEDKIITPYHTEDKYVIGGQLFWNFRTNLTSRIQYEYESRSLTAPNEDTVRDDFLVRLNYQIKHHFSILGYYRLEHEKTEMDPFDATRIRTTTCLLGSQYQFNDRTDLTASYKWKYIEAIDDEHKQKFFIEAGYLLTRWVKLALGYEYLEYSLENHPEEDYKANVGYFSIMVKL